MMEQIYYKYVKMELEQFAMFNESFPTPGDDVQFQTELQFSYDKEQQILCNIIVVKATNGDKIILKADMRSFFHFSDESIAQLRRENGLIVFFPQLLIQFASLNYGALRGVLFEKTKGTVLSDYILPPLSLNRIIDKSFDVI